MVEHWKHSGPPVYMSVASYLGMVKPRSKTGGAPKNTSHPVTQSARSGANAEEISKYGNLEELAAMFGETGGVIQ